MYAELLAQLPQQDRLNVDETGHKDNGKGMWTWCFRAPLFTLFKIDPSRGSEVLVATRSLEFDGVLAAIRELFAIIHRREEYGSEQEFHGALEDQGFEVWTQATFRTPATNNLAEQAIRFVVLVRKVTQGTRSLAGRQWSESIWTAIVTCTQHGRSVFDFLSQTVGAFFSDTPPPTN
ncbi:Transposase IS66 family protein [Anatilimnocola aggregata]|uniref:Transposase IS66 family protein n=1 Tax=Anatilimnocola aggregata TaxID=2528021 RepID=A0A517YH09_9BACT|nr:Transposase IS66 family protein [Anatilimnocola aggregata]